jgi:hypothetical protein
MGTCRMSAGSGDVGRSLDWSQVEASATGAYGVVIEPGLVTRGSEQHEQKWQFGAHPPPERSVGQLSSQSASPQIAARPLTLNVSKAKKTMRTARRTARVFHGTLRGVRAVGSVATCVEIREQFSRARRKTIGLGTVDNHRADVRPMGSPDDSPLVGGRVPAEHAGWSP